MENQIITLEALPVLKNSIKEAGLMFDQMAVEVGLGSEVVVTSENRPLVKSMVAEITRKYNEFETSRKALKNQLLKDYEDLMVVYKVEISDRYAALVEQAKKAIAASEQAEIEEKISSAKSYLSEALAAKEIDYVNFEQLPIKFNLSISPKKIREEIDQFIDRLLDAERLIDSEEYRVEIMTEFKRNGLNASRAILDVKARKTAEKAEAARQAEAVYQTRCSQLRAFGMVSHQLPPVFDYPGDNSISISLETIRQSSNDAFEAALAELKSRVNAILKPETQTISVTKAPTIEAPKPTTASETTPTLHTIVFEAVATHEQFKKLAEFLRQNNITFKTL